ncbi:MAG: branched-chain amino acid ABC transporter substrate-binding protein [Spirochaetales bacterium]|nr:branched-chain amino acid ABC transporter substrate-binding protein [Spirochaetales bacterium]
MIVGSLGSIGELYLLNIKLVDVASGKSIATKSRPYESLEALVLDSENVIGDLFGISIASSPVRIETQSTEDPATIKIGVAGAHTGDLASYGLPSLRAAELITRSINESGGIRNRKIELLVIDDQCKAELAARAAGEMVEEGAIGVIGHICSSATRAALDVYKDHNIIAISPSSTTPALTKDGTYPNFIRTISNDTAQSSTAAAFINYSLRLSNIAVLHDGGTYGKDYAESFRSHLEDEGNRVILFEEISVGASSYSGIGFTLRP